MSGDTFYDIHMHAFNLSHPYFRAFIKRFRIDRIMTLAGFVSFFMLVPVLRHIVLRVVNRMLKKVRNLLSVMESDIGSFFLTTEDCIRESGNALLKADSLHIGGRTYQRIVLTPLMMDFGQKGIGEDPDIHYSRPSEKPIVEQVTDVFNAIRKYVSSASSPELTEKYPHLTSGTKRVFEIYPFLGLNTKNYDMARIQKMLDKYFSDYHGRREDFVKNAGQFDGNIEHLASNVFAGVKVYPPLGFDPWPDSQKENEKVAYLYSYCSEKQIPITAHGSAGGFVAVSKSELKRNTSLGKWEEVLKRYPSLKLNIAHFPVNSKRFWVFPPAETDRLRTMVRLVLNNESVYVDFSIRSVSDNYYRLLRRVIDGLSDQTHKQKLQHRILFGTDFPVNLMSIDSYNAYLDIFSRTEYLTAQEKHLFCSENPERFLFLVGD